MTTDSERLDWLEMQYGYGLISDDNDHWAVADTGMNNTPMTDAACDIQTTFFIETECWRNSVREAIDAAMELDKPND